MKKNKIIINLFIYLFLTIVLLMILEEVIQKEQIVLYSVGMIINYLIIIATIYFFNKKEIKLMFKDFRHSWKKYLKKDLVTWLIGFILMLIVNYLIYYKILKNIPLNEQIVRELYSNYLIYSIITNALLAPLLEEFVFRLGFNQIKNKYLYLFLSSLIFALLHSLGSINNLISLIYLLPYFILGVTFGIIYYRSKNVFNSVLFHSFHNILTMILYMIF